MKNVLCKSWDSCEVNIYVMYVFFYIIYHPKIVTCKYPFGVEFVLFFFWELCHWMKISETETILNLNCSSLFSFLFS